MATAQNNTSRANARTLPKPPPGSAESLKQKTAELGSMTALLKAAKAVEREPVDESAFGRAYSRWLAALAKCAPRPG